MSDAMTGAVASAPASTGGAESSTPAPAAESSTSSSTLFEPLDEPVRKPASKEEPTAESQPPEAQVPQEPEKPAETPAFYRGKYKSLEDFEKSHEELEKAFYQAARERAQFAKYAQDLQAAQQPEPKPEPRFFHEFDNDKKRATWEDFHANFEKDPESMIFNMGVNIPYYVENAVKQALQNQDIINPMKQSLVESAIQAQERLKEETAFYAKHINDMAEKFPMFKQYEEPIYNVLNFMNQHGIVEKMRNSGADPVEYAFRYVLGSVADQQKANVVAIAQENARQEAAQAGRGFQLTNPSQSRTVNAGTPKADPLGMFKNEKPKMLFEY